MNRNGLCSCHSYLALSDCGREVRHEAYRTSKKLLDVLDALLKDSGQEYTDLWRITCCEPGGRHTFDTACEVVDGSSEKVCTDCHGKHRLITRQCKWK